MGGGGLKNCLYKIFVLTDTNMLIEYAVFSLVEPYQTCIFMWEMLHLPSQMKLNFYLAGVTGGATCALVHSPGTDWTSKLAEEICEMKVAMSGSEQVCMY